jgi:two-component system sensor histidine kinase/response regulator
MKKGLVLILALAISACANAQGNRIAKLLRDLTNARHDTIKVNLYYSISRRYWDRNLDSVLLMATKGIELADSIGFKKGKAINCLSMGVGLSGKGNHPEAIKYYLEALKLSEELNLEGLSGNIYGNIAIAYSERDNISKAIEYFNKALHIAEKYGEAATCQSLINLADLYTKTGEYEAAKKYASRALKISRDQTDSSNLAISLFNISEIYRKTNRNDSARWYLGESMLISTRINDVHGVSYCLNSLAEMEVNEGKFREGIVLANQSLANLKRVEGQELLMTSYRILYQCHFRLGDFEKALHYRNQEIALRDKIFNIEKEREANNLVNQYNLERKELQIKLLEKDNRLQQQKIARESLVKTIFEVGSIALALLAGYLIYTNIRWRNYNRIIKERNTQIEEQKKTIIHQKVHLGRLNSVKDKIISIISHDFKSPLSTLRGFLQLLKYDAISQEEKAQTIGRIERSLTVTLELIDNLLAWGTGQMGGPILNTITFDLGKLVDENIQLIHHRAQTKKVSVVNNVPTPTFLCGDRNTINMVLRNLISNAIKFSRPNDSILISAREESNRIIISVQDTGVGMTQTQMNSLFDGSLNASKDGTENEKGTGLGLVLCKELIQKHGGEIWVESTLDEGSTFFFSIPCTKDFAQNVFISEC